MKKAVFLYGAYGHTGQFVLRELLRRGWPVVAAGRDASKLESLSSENRSGISLRIVSTTPAHFLLDAAKDTVAIINCAGPFEDTAWPLIDLALKLEIPYLDVTGEAEVAARAFSEFGQSARSAGIAVMPATGFYGALGDVLATAVAAEWKEVDSISIGYALDGWKPTTGTKNVMARMAGRRSVFREGKVVQITEQPQFTTKKFSAEIGAVPVMSDYPGPEGTLISSHMAVRNVTNYMAVAALKDLRDLSGKGPEAIDEFGRSNQKFHVEIEVEKNGQLRRGWASGRDIYAITAPIVIEALERILVAKEISGVVSAGEAFPPVSFLNSLSSSGLNFYVAQ
jgi:short subunit dehydrogenase-like uncharacterized protein